jgi:hypothetical protein
MSEARHVGCPARVSVEMARKTTSRIELRRQAEAAARSESAEAAEKKKTAAPKAKKLKDKPVARKRLIWVVYNGSMKEEGRFPYDQRAAAEEKIEQLRQKSKKLYFIQPVKEVIGDPSATVGLAAAAAAAKLVDIEDVTIPDEIPVDAEAEFEEEEEEAEELDDDDE